ncbi:hypothetical protein BDR26DRAFT_862047 [Obelidium mucronatum]|nr:hypothetical protein BDR26DRAFT_862047 [Obelidium mucronatum]
MSYDQSAILIQKTYRGYRVRQWVSSLESAAVKLQTIFRGFLARKRYDAILKTNRSLECHDTRLQTIQSRLSRHEKDMMLLKGTHREKIVQVSLEWQTKAAVTIQKIFRGYYQRQQYHKLLSSSLKKHRRSHRQPKQQQQQQRTVKFESDSENDNENNEKGASTSWDRIATSEESDIVEAREKVIARLYKTRNPQFSSTSTRERETAANLLANLGTAQRLLDQYYDSIDEDDFTTENALKFLPQDVSLGCRGLRMRTEDYVRALLDCSESLEDPSELIFKKSLLESSNRAYIREEHLRSLKDGKMRWWEFDLENYAAFDELMDLDAEDVEKSSREY